jgi:AraC family ethanolamine operon transcriptional activator
MTLDKQTAQEVSAIAGHGRDASSGVDAEAGLIEAFDVEEHEASVQPWEVRFTQLSCGRFHSQIHYVKTPGMLLYEERGLRRALAHGAVPAGLIMVGTNVDSQQSRMDWCGETVDRGRFACGAPGSEVDFFFPDHNHNVVMLVEPGLLARSLGEESIDVLCGRRHLSTSAKYGSRLVATIAATVRKYTLRPDLLDDPREACVVEARALDALGACLDGPDANDPPEPRSTRRAAVRRAVDYVLASTERITTLDLTRATGVSRRTVEYAFRELLGVTPAQYLRLHHLNGVHRDLADADPRSSTITGLALRWGFGHPGRFAAKYHRLFGVMPSETLRKDPCSPRLRFPKHHTGTGASWVLPGT